MAAGAKATIRKRSIQAGAGCIAISCIYFSLATIPPCAAFMAGFLDTAPDRLYGHWIVFLLCGGICATTVVGSVAGLTLTARHLGAWIAHAGLLLLALGGSLFALYREVGYAVTTKTRNGWSDIDAFYLKDTNRIVAAVDGGTQYETDLPPGRRLRNRHDPGRVRALDTAIEIRSPRGTDIRLTGWAEDIATVAAVDFRLKTGDRTRAHALRGEPGRNLLRCEGFDIAFLPNPSMQRIRRLLFPDAHAESGPADQQRPETRPAGPGPDDGAEKKKKPVRPRVVLVTGVNIRPQVVLVMPDDTRRQAPLQLGRDVALPFGAPPFPVLNIARTYTVAGGATHRDAANRSGRMTAARIDITAGDWQTTTLIPRGWMRGMPARILLPGGRTLQIELIPRARPLGATVAIEAIEYVPYPGSMMARDYVTEVTVERDGEDKKDTIRLNSPVMAGPYQLSQNTWGPQPADPLWISLGVATRPGIIFAWIGFAMICLSMPYAFYVKPLLARRAARSSAAAAADSPADTEDAP